MAVILVSHDLGVVLDMATGVAVMYAGQIVDIAHSAGIYAAPRHPYTAVAPRAKCSLPNKGHSQSSSCRGVSLRSASATLTASSCHVAHEHLERAAATRGDRVGPDGSLLQPACWDTR